MDKVKGIAKKQPLVLPEVLKAAWPNFGEAIGENDYKC